MGIDRQHWQARLSALTTDHAVPGAQLGILRTGAGPDHLVEAATGVLHTGTGAPVRPDSLFQIGSITKVWTATLVMQLADEGRLDLDAPVAEVLPALRLGEVTPRHLLTHTGGLEGDVFTDTGRGDGALTRYVDLLDHLPRHFPLGATWSYCNSGYSLLGLLVERLAGRPWDRALHERLVTPLGLRSTVTLPEDAILHSVAVGHHDGGPAPVWALPRAAGPAGGISARAADVLAFAGLHLAGGRAPDGTRLLSPASVSAMAAHQADVPDPRRLGDSWGLGWIRYGWSGRRLVGHDGTTVGQSAFLRVLPDPDGAGGLAVVLLTNGGRAADLADALFRELFPALAGVDLPARFGPPSTPFDGDLSGDLGSYRRAGCRHTIEKAGRGLQLRTELSGDLARLSPRAEEVQPLVPVGPGLYAAGVPESDHWVSVVSYRLPTGERYLHHGGRAARRV